MATVVSKWQLEYQKILISGYFRYYPILMQIQFNVSFYSALIRGFENLDSDLYVPLFWGYKVCNQMQSNQIISTQFDSI
jgi:hypothetical protein